MLTVIDNFLDTGSGLYQEITDHDTWKNSPNESWMDRDHTPDDVWQAVCDKIWSFSSSILPAEFDGIEYWAGQIEEGHDLEWHQDKDEFRAFYAKERKLVTPYVGAIYYAHTYTPHGGFLEIQRGSDTEPQFFERIQPVPNRLVIFDTGSFHQVTPVFSGTRRHIATNIWIDKPMEENYTLLAGRRGEYFNLRAR